MTGPLLVFADSNVTLSAALGGTSDFQLFWRLPGVEILPSQYSMGEVTRNLKRPDDRARMWRILYKSHLVPDDEDVVLPPQVILPAKDIPVIQAAVAGGADVLITGDKIHFGAYWSSEILGVQIESPKMFERRYPQYFQEMI